MGKDLKEAEEVSHVVMCQEDLSARGSGWRKGREAGVCLCARLKEHGGASVAGGGQVRRKAARNEVKVVMEAGSKRPSGLW